MLAPNIALKPSGRKSLPYKDELFQAAGLYLEAGFSVIPLIGGESPRAKESFGRWQQYQQRHAQIDDVNRWLERGAQALGIVTGSISSLVVLDIDDEKLELEFQERFPE